MTPVVFLAAGLFFGLAVLTYVEGASLHQERAGSTVFARYAFNELISFVAAWAILLDFLILVAVAAYMTSDYIAVIWHGLAHGAGETVFGLGVVLCVAVRHLLGFASLRAP